LQIADCRLILADSEAINRTTDENQKNDSSLVFRLSSTPV
jgi:hypothetical protein